MNAHDPRGRNRGEEGFTLVEVIVALAILAFGLLAIATMQATAIKGNSQAMGLTEAATFAQDRLERLMSLPYTNSDLNDTDNDGTAGLDDTVDSGGSVIADHSWTEPGNTYTVYWNVALNQPIENVKTVHVIVRWTDRGLRRSATFEFMKSEVI